MDSTELKELLLKLLEDFIGHYEVNGLKVPAIRQNSIALSIQKRVGLEVVISRTPLNIKAGMNTNSNNWNINLIQHEGSNHLGDAISKLATLDIFVNCFVLPALVTRDSKIPEQANITLIDTVFTKIQNSTV
jgi:hypothetical protein